MRRVGRPVPAMPDEAGRFAVGETNGTARSVRRHGVATAASRGHLNADVELSIADSCRPDNAKRLGPSA